MNKEKVTIEEVCRVLGAPMPDFDPRWEEVELLGNCVFYIRIVKRPIYDATEETQEQLEKEMAENARLIAAAPDMLEALEAVLNDDGVAPLPFPQRLMVEQAIAKAKGGADE